MNKTLTVLIIEPNSKLKNPYNLFKANKFKLFKVVTINKALSWLTNHQPDLVLLSTSYSPKNSLTILEALKNSITTSLIPLIFVVDFTKPLITIPGTSWGEKLGIIHPFTAKTELQTTLKRLLS